MIFSVNVYFWALHGPKIEKKIFFVFFGSIFFSSQTTRRPKIGKICTHNGPNIGWCHLDTILILLGSFWPSMGPKKCPNLLATTVKFSKNYFFLYPLMSYIILKHFSSRMQWDYLKIGVSDTFWGSRAFLRGPRASIWGSIMTKSVIQMVIWLYFHPVTPS